MKDKIIRLLLSVLLAFGMWVYVVTVVSPESEETFYNIQVVYEEGSEDALLRKGLMITSGDLPTVSITLRGNRTDLNSLKNSDIAATVDLSKISSANNQMLTVKVTVTGGSFEIVSQSLAAVTVQVAEWTTSEVPVVVDFGGTLGLDYIAYKDELVLDRETVTLTGPKDLVDQITQAVVRVDLTDRVESITNASYGYTLCDKDGEAVDITGITPDVETVKLTVKIQRVKEIQLAVNVIYGGGATEENTTVILDQQTIKVSGSDTVLDALGDKLVLGTIKLAEIQENTTLTYELEELLQSKGVDNLSGITEVTAEISFMDLVTKTLTVTQIDVTGLPGNMDYSVDAKKLTVTVRGPEELISSISAEDITVTVDLTNAALGTDRYTARFEMGEGFEAVGIIGSHMVAVTLTEAAGGNG